MFRVPVDMMFRHHFFSPLFGQSNQVNNQSLISSTDVIQLTLTLKMTTTQVVETSVTANNNSPIQDYVHPDNHTQPTYDWLII